ncbi:MAG: threonine aldolase family protein [Rhizomicrobium sp.]
MNFVSDNAYGASPEILAAVARAAEGTAVSYGEDALTVRVRERLAEIFEHELAAFAVVSGTAANALSLAVLCPMYGAVFCHRKSHIAVDECGAPEFFTGGGKLVLLEGEHARIGPAAIEAALGEFSAGVHSPKPAVVSITQASEMGAVYTPAQIRALADCAHGHGMALHMDGARFANAVASLGCAPADIAWRAGVDALSLGATKNGALMAEVAIFFDPARAAGFAYRQKKAGHLVSKMRFVSAQLDAYLAAGRWLDTARRANALAARLGEGLRRIAGVTLAAPVEANAVFAWMPGGMAARLRQVGARFYDWETSRDGRVLARLVCAFATPDEDVDRLLEIARASGRD